MRKHPSPQILTQALGFLLVLSSSPLSLASPSTGAVAGKKPTNLDGYIEQAHSEYKQFKKKYDEKVQLTRTNQFKPEMGSIVVEVGSQMPEWQDRAPSRPSEKK